jgi:DNA polymerase III delta subunit
MRINFAQFDLSTSPQLPSLIGLSGDEPFLIEQLATELCQYWQSARYHVSSFDLWVAGQSEALTQAVKCLSLFEPARVLLIRVKKISELKSIQDRLWDALLTPPPHVAVLWLLPKLDHSAQRASWLTRLEKNGLHIVVWPLNPSQHLQWLLKLARGASLTLSVNQAQRITALNEGNPQGSKQILQRLSLRFNQAAIPDCALDEELSEAGYFHAFDLAASCLRGESQRALHQLQRLQVEQEEPLLILGALAYEIRQLLQSKTKISNPSRKGLYQHAWRREPAPGWWWQQLTRIATLETLCKTRSFDVWRALSILILAMCGHPLSMPDEASIPCHAQGDLW